MKYFLIFPYYLGWHYSKGAVELFFALKNFVLFIPSFFSFATLLKTLISPYQRLQEHYHGGLNLSELFEVVTVNIIMRIVGLIIRTFFLLIGILSFIIVLTFCLVIYVAWFFVPFLIAFLFITSLISLFN